MTQINAHPDALQFLTDRKVMPKDSFLALGDEARMRAFTIAKQTDAAVLQETLDAVKQHLADGGTMWTFREKFPDLVAPYTEAGREWHLRLIVEQNLRQAQAVGAHAQRQELKAAFPYVQYQAGINPRPSHAALDGKIFAVDDPFILAHTPPWEFGCNCDLISRTAAQAGKVRAADQGKPVDQQRMVEGNAKLEQLVGQNKMPDATGGLHPVDVRPPALKGGEYSFRPDRLNQPVDLAGFDPEVRARLEEELKTVGYTIDGDTALPPGDGPHGNAGLTGMKTRIGQPVGRIVAFKAQGTAGKVRQTGGERLGRPLGRIGRAAPQIERIAIPSSRLEAA